MKGAIEKTHQLYFFFKNHQIQVLMKSTLIPSFQKKISTNLGMASNICGFHPSFKVSIFKHFILVSFQR
jgi:hypothetical protein